VEAPGPPVYGGAVNDWGQDGVFVCEGDGEGTRFVSVRNLEDQTLVAAVVVVVDLVPVVLRRRCNQSVQVHVNPRRKK